MPLRATEKDAAPEQGPNTKDDAPLTPDKKTGGKRAQQTPSAARQAGGVPPAKSGKQVYRASASKPAAAAVAPATAVTSATAVAPATATRASSAAKKPAALSPAQEKEAKRLADAKAAAAAARQQATQKRSRVSHAETPAADILDAASDTAAAGGPKPLGSIFAAAVREGAAVWDGGETLPEAGAAQQAVAEEQPPAALQLDTRAAQEQPEPEIVVDAVADAPAPEPELGRTSLLPAFPFVSAAAAQAAEEASEKKKKRRKASGKTAANKRGATVSFPSNRGEGGNPFVRTVGSVLYQLGFYAECKILLALRFARDLGIFTGQVFAWMFGGFFRSIGRFFASIAHDFAAPFHRLGRGLKNARAAAVQERKLGSGNTGKVAVEYITTGVKHHGHLVRNLLGMLLPVAAVAVFVFVIYGIFGMQYALAVTVEGETIGYITDRSVLDDAKSMVRNRLRLASDQEMEDFKFDPVLSIEKTSKITPKDDLANTIMGGYGAVGGTGLTIDGELVAATTEGKKLEKFLNNKLKEHEDPNQPDAKIAFVKEVECDPDRVEAFIPETLQDLEKLEEKLDSNVTEEVHYTTQPGETVASAAQNTGVSVEHLVARNDSLAPLAPEDELPAGTDLLVQNAQPYLQVKKTVRRQAVETIPHQTVEQETDEYTIGSRFVSQQGADGEQEVWYDDVYIDGELVSSDVVPDMTNVLSQPVEEIILVGTHELPTITNSTVPNAPAFITGGGNYLFPVPTSTFSSRGMSDGHRGRDLNANFGDPVYACADGVVVTAEYHFSWGNYIVIQHPDGYSTLYGHNQALHVSVGQVVTRGQYIAEVGSTGMSTGPHVHLEVWAPGGGLCDPDAFITLPY